MSIYSYKPKDKYTIEELKSITIGRLKIIGHHFLKIYILLDLHRGLKGEKQHAYEKLARMLNVPEPLAHFGVMQSPEQVIKAIQKLKIMIKGRESKLIWQRMKRRNKEKNQYAKNLIEIQKHK